MPRPLAVAVAALIVSAGSLVGATSAEATSARVTLPPTPDNSFAAVSCPTSTTCVAAGQVGVAGGTAAALDVASASGWSFVTPPLPPTAATVSPQSSFSGLSCATAAACVAVGSFLDHLGNTEALVDVLSAGVWSSVTVPLPADAAVSTAPGAKVVPEPANSLAAVSCASTTSCSAVGSYVDTHGNLEALAVTDASGTWTAAAVPLPADAATSTTPAAGSSTPEPANILDAVSCSSSASCAVGGSYVDTAGDAMVLLDTRTAATWSNVLAPLPASAATSGPGAISDNLASITCTADATCVAVGDFQDATGSSQPLIEVETSSSWSNVAVALPPNAGVGTSSSPVANDLQSVSCTSNVDCVAVGGYQDANSNTAPLVVTESSGSWSASAAPLPADADVRLFLDNLDAVSCSSTGNCAAVGFYVSNQGPRTAHALLDVQIAGTWQAGTVVLPGDANTASPYNVLDAVDCTTATTCVAGGVYVDAAGNNQALLDELGLALEGVPIVPSPPTQVRVVPGHGQATIYWSASTSSGGSPLLEYTATADPSGATCTAPARSTSCTVRGLPGDVAYRFAVTATSAIGTSLPSVPTPLTVVTPSVVLRASISPFPANSAVLTAALRSQVRSLAARIGVFGDSHVALTGFSDTTSTPTRRLAVSRQRAQAVAAYLSARLAALGIAGVRITWSGRGDAAPVATNATANGRAHNRRVQANGG